METNITDGYFVNDPAVNLIEELKIPEIVSPCPPFTVSNFNWKPGVLNSVQRDSFCVFVSMTNTINTVQNLLENKIINWASNSSLKVFPRAGVQFNAFYDRESLQFFYQKHPKKDKVIYTAQSPDVVCHETGHGILDALRPDIWHVQSLEIFAFHEAFADSVSILTSLKNPNVVSYLLKETNGDLRKSNLVSKIAEELGEAIAAMNNKSADCLRDAINEFKYVPPERLSRFGSGLTSEPHNFSRIFTGAFYELIVNLYEGYKSTMEPIDAINLAANKAGSVLLNGIKNAVIKPRFFESIANSMLNVDVSINENITKVFQDRQILNRITNVQKMNINGDDFMPSFASAKVCNLNNEVGIDGNPLYNLNIEVPHEDNNLGMAEEQTPAEAIEAAKNCLDYLHEKDKVGEGKEFEVKDNGLFRRRICIC